jgi:hypothetical protein
LANADWGANGDGALVEANADCGAAKGLGAWAEEAKALVPVGAGPNALPPEGANALALAGVAVDENADGPKALPPEGANALPELTPCEKALPPLGAKALPPEVLATAANALGAPLFAKTLKAPPVLGAGDANALPLPDAKALVPPVGCGNALVVDGPKALVLPEAKGLVPWAAGDAKADGVVLLGNPGTPNADVGAEFTAAGPNADGCPENAEKPRVVPTGGLAGDANADVPPVA